MVEGSIKDAGRMTDEIMNEHMACTRAAMERGMIFMSGLKADMSGGLSVMRQSMQANYRITWTMSRFLFMEYRSTGWLNLMFIM